MLRECEQERMFVRRSHPNVSTFSANVSATGATFSANVSWTRAMFARRRRYVLESLQIALAPSSRESRGSWPRFPVNLDDLN
jgi:hypothetical protein